MVKANLTIQLDTEVIRRARIVAAKRGMSVSAIVARDLTDLADRDALYEEGRARAEELLAQATPRGGRAWRREDLHER
jgi:antitoxin component of RelBE/YafQ-DinJ toxin-antitoxin module